MKRNITILSAILVGLLMFGLMAGHRDEFPGRRQGGGSRGATEVPVWAQK